MSKVCGRAVTKTWVNNEFIGRPSRVTVQTRCGKDPGHDGRCLDKYGNSRANNK